MHTRSLAPTAVVAALMTLLVIAAAIVTRGDGSEPVPAVVPAATPEPDGAEEWMYLQRANADGTIPDAAVNEAISQSKAMGQASKGSPATDQVWTELGPSNIGGRLRDESRGSDDAGRRLRRNRQRRPLEVHRRRRDAEQRLASLFPAVAGRGRSRLEGSRLGRQRRARPRRRLVLLRQRHLQVDRRRRDLDQHGPRGRRHGRRDRDRPAQRRPGLRRRPGRAPRHPAQPRPVHDRRRRGHLDPRPHAAEHHHRRHRRGRQQDEPRHHARDDVGQDPRREVARLRPALLRLPLDRRRPHVGQRPQRAAPAERDRPGAADAGQPRRPDGRRLQRQRPEPGLPDLEHGPRQLQRLLHEHRCGRDLDSHRAPDGRPAADRSAAASPGGSAASTSIR